MLDQHDLAPILCDQNATQRDLNESSDVLTRIDQQALAYPDRTALICLGDRLTYGQLDKQSRELASRLSALSVGPEVIVGIRLDRNVHLVVAMLAVLRLRAAYLPIDTSVPAERATYMLDNSRAAVLLTTTALSEQLPTHELRVVCVDALAEQDVLFGVEEPSSDSEHLAYVIYTSGSTGKPKGVQISREALANVIASFEHELQVHMQDVFLSTTGISFDIFGLELFLPLCIGGTLVLADRDRLLEPNYLPGLATRHGATLFQATPSLVRNLLDTGWQPDGSMRLLVGGEALTADIAKRLETAARVFNVYGPTEATIWVSLYRLVAGSDGPPPIGHPIWNTQLYVLDGFLEPSPPGVTGELYIGGVQLARGYVNRPDLTAERFIPHPFAKGERLYRTGDLARWRTDGELEYVGRADQQLKIRGHRIEPGEIESVLVSHPAVTGAVVIPRDDLPGGPQLVAYFTPAADWTQKPDTELIRKQTSAWREIYDGRYAQETVQTEHTDAAVWTNSYTGQPYETAAMREWIDTTVSRLASFQARQILEIGCGSGLLMLPLAPSTERYVGTDISHKALESLALKSKFLPQIELLQLPADGIATLAPTSFDLIVINSVVQYFPSASYLLEVLDQALSLLAPGGHLFIGDVRHLGLLPAFHASVEMHQAPMGFTNGELLQEVAQRCRHESELCLEPAFFASLSKRYTLHSVQVLSRRGYADTEMNNFRFDAVLQRAGSGCGPCSLPNEEVRWNSIEWTMAHLQALLEDAAPHLMVLRGLADARVQDGLGALKGAKAANSQLPVVRGAAAVHGIHPEAVIATALRVGWSATVRATASDGTFDVLLAPLSVAGPAPVFAEPLQLQLQPQMPERLANNPLTLEMERRLEEQLRLHMAKQLPDYMVPAFFVPLERLPLTTNGKLDRRALPRPDGFATAESSPPRDDVEAKVGALMAEVLGLPYSVGGNASFFALGGHSLSAVRLVARLREALGADVGLKAVFEGPTVEELAARVREAGVDHTPELVTHSYAPGTRVAMSHAQEALWFLDRLDGPSATYNMPFALRLEGPLNIAALEQAFSQLVERHSVLRTVYLQDGGSLVGIQAAQSFQLPVARGLIPINRFIHEITRASFDLSRDLMLRAHLLHIDDTTHVLAIAVHHIAADGLSIGVMGKELGELYEAASSGRATTLPKLGAQYADYAKWHRTLLEPAELERQLNWWRFHLQDAPDVLSLPSDRPRPAVSRHQGCLLTFKLEPSIRSRVEALASERGVTSFSVLLAAYGALLSRLAGQGEVVVGTPVAGRKLTQLEGLIGLFVNALPLRLAPGGTDTVIELLRATHATVKGGLLHQDVPFDQLVQHLGVARSLGHMPVFQAMFSYLAQEETLALPGLHTTMIPVDLGITRFDLTLQLAADAQGGYTATIEFDHDLFDLSTIERWAGHYRCILKVFTQQPSSILADLPLMDEMQAKQVLVDWNTDDVRLDASDDVVTLFERQARQHPDAIAVVCNNERITYGELDRRSTQLAQHLWGLGARAESVVGIHLERSIDLMVSIFAVLKTGAAYLPLDSELPPDRLAYMLNNSGTGLVLSTGALLNAVSTAGLQALCIDVAQQIEQPPGSPQSFSSRDPDSLAYLIYTSGSTGRPKGVQVSHRSLATFLPAFERAHQVRQTDVAVCIASISFDMFISETLPFLCTGGTLVLADRHRLLDRGYFENLVAAEAVTVMAATPSLVRNLLNTGWAPSRLIRVTVGGEALSQDLAERLCSMTSIWNGYGPTEATISPCSALLFSPIGARPPIGRPFPNSRLYVLDSRLGPVPTGVVGELYIGGAQLARGYAGRPDLTAERFIPNPFATGERLYRTGDLVRWRADGQLEHLGRADHQVKIRGYRIELGEIENALASHPDVVGTAVIVREDTPGDKQLVAYVLSRGSKPAEACELQAHLSRMLPAYMVPAAFVPLDKLPVTRNGKLDTRALPAPNWLGTDQAATAPLDPLEKQVANLMAQVLQLQAIPGAHLSFFTLGGHSLSAVRLIARLREVFSVEIRLKSFFETPTVAGLARHLRSCDKGAVSQSPFVCFSKNSVAQPLFIVHGADGNAVNFRKLGRRLEPHACVYGIDTVHIWRPYEPNEHLNVEQLARLYADRILSDFPDLQDIRLGGWSFGGLVVLEMVRYLTRIGRRVACAFAIDSALHWAATDLLSAMSLDTGFESVARQHLLEIGHDDAEIQALLADKSPESFLHQLAIAFKSHTTAASRYMPEPYSSDFTLILADKGTALDAQSIAGWRTAIGGHLTERVIEGTHWSILREPAVDALADEIAQLLTCTNETAS